MAKEYKEKKLANFEVKVEPQPVVEVAPAPAKVKFLVWFTEALARFQGVKAHHMSAIRAYFVGDLGLGEVATPEEFDNGLEKFGFGRKK